MYRQFCLILSCCFASLFGEQEAQTFGFEDINVESQENSKDIQKHLESETTQENQGGIIVITIPKAEDTEIAYPVKDLIFCEKVGDLQ